MKFVELLTIVGDQPVFSSALLRAGDVAAIDVATQLSRWTAAGRLISLRRGLYALAPEYRKRDPHPFEVANAMVHPSYVSLESALAFHGLLPEAVFVTTSVTTARGGTYRTPLGEFGFRHLMPSLFRGYRSERLGPPGAEALVARPEKALLDLVYLRPGGDSAAFLRQLRLDRMETLDLTALDEFAHATSKPKLLRAAGRIARLAEDSAKTWEER